jgi:hypothetical protein
VAREVDLSDPEQARYLEFSRDAYGPAWDCSAERYSDRTGSGFDAWIDATRMYAMGPRPEATVTR